MEVIVVWHVAVRGFDVSQKINHPESINWDVIAERVEGDEPHAEEWLARRRKDIEHVEVPVPEALRQDVKSPPLLEASCAANELLPYFNVNMATS